jgi:hypothetical protein
VRDLAGLIGNVPDPDVRRVLSLLAAEAGPDGQSLQGITSRKPTITKCRR